MFILVVDVDGKARAEFGPQFANDGRPFRRFRVGFLFMIFAAGVFFALPVVGVIEPDPL